MHALKNTRKRIISLFHHSPLLSPSQGFLYIFYNIGRCPMLMLLPPWGAKWHFITLLILLALRQRHHFVERALAPT